MKSEKRKKTQSSQTGLAGEFYVLAQLTQRGFVAALTLGNTKNIDILVKNSNTGEQFQIEVKTTRKGPRKAELFGDGLFYIWQMSEKHERIRNPRHIYVFVHLALEEVLPFFFVVPSADVARYVRWQHKRYLAKCEREGRQIKDTSMRKFRIGRTDPKGYRNNWKILA